MSPDGGNMWSGLRLVNNTGQTLNQFTLTFDGEQWRDSGLTAETLSFGFSTSATTESWFGNVGFTSVPALNFTSPVSSGTAGVVDGNGAGKVADITSTVTNFDWLPGTDLWLRWTDPQRSGGDDGIGIDNLRFSANDQGTGVPMIVSVMSGSASAASTWSNNAPPAAGSVYRVLDTHTVTIDAPFVGTELRATSGGVVNYGVSAVHVPLLIVESGGNLTESVSGDFALGDIGMPLGSLITAQDLSFDIDAGANFFLDMILSGTGNLDFNGAAGSSLSLTAAAAHEGTIRFAGAGDTVMITESQSFGILEMNSTGANTIVYNPQAEIGGGTLIFNEAGTVDHAATTTSPQRRLHGMDMLVANAPVSVDLTKGFPDNGSQAEERRLLVGNNGIAGSADITVNGTAVDYSNGTNIGHNEFEVGSTPDPTAMSVSTYSGTISTNDYVDLEIRRHFPNARFVINNHARLEMGNQAVNSIHSVQMGEVVINSGGTLEVGFEQTAAAGEPGHHMYKLTLTSSGDREGSLTLADGSTTRMQVNGTAVGQFDSIVAEGDVQLNGTLNVLVNPDASSGGTSTTPNPHWTPTLGDKFDIITIASVSPPGDYNGNGTVGPEDYAEWVTNFESSNPAADGNGNGIVDAADYVVWRANEGATGGIEGTISGTFDAVTVTDFNGAMAGFAFQVNYSTTAVQLEVIAAGSGASAAVPEPLTAVLVALLLPLSAIVRRRRRDSVAP
jgi:hypothetical protein